MDYKNTKDRMDKTISVLREELSIIRAGRKPTIIRQSYS